MPVHIPLSLMLLRRELLHRLRDAAAGHGRASGAATRIEIDRIATTPSGVTRWLISLPHCRGHTVRKKILIANTSRDTQALVHVRPVTD